jgi:hypothetical protein
MNSTNHVENLVARPESHKGLDGPLDLVLPEVVAERALADTE